MTVAEQFAQNKIAEAAKAALHAGLTLDQGWRQMELAMAQAAVDKYRTKLRAARNLGVHRNRLSRLGIRKQGPRRKGQPK